MQPDITVGGFNLILLMIWSGLTEEIYNEQFYFISYTVIAFLMIGSILTLCSIFFFLFFTWKDQPGKGM